MQVVFYTLQVSLSELLFVADNLAYFSYQQLDEPLFVVNHIDVIVSTSGSSVLDTFSEVTVMLMLQLLGINITNVTERFKRSSFKNILNFIKIIRLYDEL